LFVSMNLIFACLPVWYEGAMVICHCGDHMAIGLKGNQDYMACCNDCEGERNKVEASPLMCSCTGIPISKDLNDHTACYTNTEEYDKTISCFDHRNFHPMDSQLQNTFYLLTHNLASGNNTIDILRTTILLI
jgi:hypothetical protein